MWCRGTSAIAVLAVLALGGCQSEVSRDLAVCQNEVLRFYPSYYAAKPDSPGSQFVIGCMATKGHAFSTVPTDCNGKLPMPVQPACYVSPSWWSRVGERGRGG